MTANDFFWNVFGVLLCISLCAALISSRRSKKNFRQKRSNGRMRNETSNMEPDAWLLAHNSLHRNALSLKVDSTPGNLKEQSQPSAEKGQVSEAYIRRLKTFLEADMANKNPLEGRLRPGPQRFGVSARGAEHLCGLWLKFLGETHVQVTRATADGGADILSTTICCQVKNYSKQPVSVGEVRDLYGTALAMKLQPLMMTSSQLTQTALDWSNEHGVTALKFNAEEGTLIGLNRLGADFLRARQY